MREAKSANFTIASLLCFPTAVIAYLPISGAAFGQENNFVLSSSAFADNGTMSQKYMAKNPANPNCIGENISPPLQWHNAPAATRSYAIIMYDQEGRNGLGLLHCASLCVHDHRNRSGFNRTEARLNDAANGRRDWVPCPRRGGTRGSLRSIT